jgi:hypothetical protein
MDVTISHTILAYLLALRDLSDHLSDREKENLKKVAKDLDLNPKAWQSHLEPDLIQIIQGNSQLDRSYQFYKEKLAQSGEIPLDLLPKATEIEWLRTDSSPLAVRGMIPNSSASGYEQQLNNVVIVINLADKPEETVKKLTFLNQVKQFLDQDSQ